MLKYKNKWFKCGTECPKPAILPIYIKNPSLFSGTYNNPGSLATQSMKYANKVNSSTFGYKRKTIIVPVTKRVIAPLSNPPGNLSSY